MPTYRERVSWPLWFHFIMAVPVLIGLWLTVYGFTRASHQPVAPALTVAMFGYVWWRMRHLAIEVGPDAVAFGFGGPRRRVPRESVASVATEEYSALRYMGWGYRFGREPRERAYSVAGHEGGLRLVFRDEKDRQWTVFLSSADPERLRAAIG